MVDRRDSGITKSGWRTLSLCIILVTGAAWSAACGDDPGPIEPQNRPPVVTLAMPNLNLAIGTADTIDVWEYFVDPDGDTLSYHAESSDTGIVNAQVYESGLTVLAVGRGKATITVSAHDPNGLAATQEFDVVVRGLDWAVLVSLYESTRGRYWQRQENWLTDEPIERWYGVGVDPAGRVTSLRLGGNLLAGPIPSNLGKLSSLSVLNLRGNSLSGPVPPELGDLELTHLDLSGNKLSGPLPPLPVVRWSRLTHMDLSGNELEGSVPERIGRSTNLTHLDLSGNRLTGPIPPQIGNLSHLTRLDLSYNELTGPIPTELGNLTALTSLSLQVNDLTGPIPAELGDLVALTNLSLETNDLTGPIPPALGNLTALDELRLSGNRLTGPIPPQLGNLTAATRLYLGANELTGSIPSELGSLTRLVQLDLHDNRLTGPIPVEIRGLYALVWLALSNNELTGPIPPELGELNDLLFLQLDNNELAGSIPPDLGRLGTLAFLDLSGNNLTGLIPAQLGDLRNLSGLDLSDNDLQDPLPAELGGLADLTTLDLSDNSFGGPIPAELGGLLNLGVLRLSGNSLTGPIPDDLGRLYNLEELHLQGNDLTMPLPVQLGHLARLRHLDLRRNARLAGEIPRSWGGLRGLETLVAHDTGLCAPGDAFVLDWLEGVLTQRLPSCGLWDAYLVQAVQSREFPVPLVAGGDGLLRVFPTAQRATEEGLPPVRATFFLDGAEVHQVEIPGKSTPVPTTIDEGSLLKSSNADIPGSVVQPGLEMVIEIDPEGTLDPGLGVTKRIPEDGRLPVRVLGVPPLDFTLIPFLWSEDPDSAILEVVEEMAESPGSHEMFSLMYTLLPVTEVTATAHEPVWTSTNVALDLYAETAAIRVMENGSNVAGPSRYLGMMSGSIEGGTGAGTYGGGRSAFVIPEVTAFAQRVGTLAGLGFVPCGEADLDPYYPYGSGSIGAWGYDIGVGELVSPATPDLMSHCDSPRWISDYHFAKAIRFRRIDGEATRAATRTSTRSLLLWGGVRADGTPHLEPAFVVDAPPASRPSGNGYEIAGWSDSGEELFSLLFGVPESDGGDGGSFAFAIPVPPEWAKELAGITLHGPGGETTLNLDTDRPMVILRDPETGRVRGILRGSRAAGLADEDAGAGWLPLRGLEVMSSRGIPGPEAWRR